MTSCPRAHALLAFDHPAEHCPRAHALLAFDHPAEQLNIGWFSLALRGLLRLPATASRRASRLSTMPAISYRTDGSACRADGMRCSSCQADWRRWEDGGRSQSADVDECAVTAYAPLMKSSSVRRVFLPCASSV